jgi:hypothetical protein
MGTVDWVATLVVACSSSDQGLAIPMIAAVATIRNEVDIVGLTIPHLIAQGVELILVADASTDGTQDLYAQWPQVCVYSDHDTHHYQPHWINALTAKAAEQGADWVVPFDADEFWGTEDGTPLARFLRWVPPEVGAITADCYQYVGMEYRQPDPGFWGKVAVRPSPTLLIANGNHSATGVAGAQVRGGLVVREVQFRSLAHLNEKSRDRVERLDPSLPVTDGAHQRVLDAMTPEGRRSAWEERVASATVYDPIKVWGR